MLGETLHVVQQCRDILDLMQEVLKAIHTKVLGLAITWEEFVQLPFPFSCNANAKIVILGKDVVPLRVPERCSPLRLRRGSANIWAEGIVASKLEDPGIIIFVLELYRRLLLEAFIPQIERMLEDFAA